MLVRPHPFDGLLAALRLGHTADGGEIAPTLLKSRADLHPHQVEAALFALGRPLGRGAILADEVGLGKTVEAGLVIAELLARGAERVLVLVPASLRAQWRSELERFFDIRAKLVDLQVLRRERQRFSTRGVIIASLTFFANETNPEILRDADWDLVVIDEAHRLRNVDQPGAKRARRLRELLRGKRKILLSATPFQNSLLELYGLVSFVDDRLLGSEASFRARFLADDRGLEGKNIEDLRQRLSQVLTRTLRRQVQDHIRFTSRKSLLFDFEPSPAEAHLYERLSEFLTRARAVALCFGNRELFLLLCRKILASSTFAIAATLRRLVLTLTERLAGRLSELGFEDDVDGFEEEFEELDQRDPRGPLTAEEIESEIAELRSYAAFAESIDFNAKGERLVAALGQVFSHAREKGWPEKAVIFTESRRTQEYLRLRLEAAGFRSKVTLLHGGSGDAEARDACIREFRERTQILLSTEVGAEGLNLQFCNIVVNYDLPWNPQRIEQRIGRCHRYGQTLDVLVVNFLNTANAADQRLYELLSAKLSLFDGLFGCSDEVLGALESGVGFERRVLEIYQSSRTTEELAAAFDRLEGDIAKARDGALARARSLLDEFDDHVRDRLHAREEKVAAAIARTQEDVRTVMLAAARESRAIEGGFVLTMAGSRGDVSEHRVGFHAGDGSGIEVLGPGHPLVEQARRTLEEDFGPPRVHDLLARASGGLEHRRGARGYWLVYLVTVTDPKPVTQVFDVAVEEESLAILTGSDLLALRAAARQHVGLTALLVPAAVQSAADAAAAERVGALVSAARGAADHLIANERRRLDRFGAETLAAARRQLERARDSGERARSRVAEIQRAEDASPTALREARALVDLFDGQLRHEERLIAEDAHRREREAQQVVSALSAAGVQGHARVAAAARFWIA